jgi:hypothetical protein
MISYNFLARTKCYSNFPCNLSDRYQWAWMISRTCNTASSMWEVDGLPGQRLSSKDRRPLMKQEYHSNVFNRLRHNSMKAACSISYISAPVFHRRKQKSMYTCCCTFPLHRDMRHTLQVDVHWKASTQLPWVPLCCNFTTYYSFPGEKISPRIKWSAHVYSHHIQYIISDPRVIHSPHTFGFVVYIQRLTTQCLILLYHNINFTYYSWTQRTSPETRTIVRI